MKKIKWGRLYKPDKRDKKFLMKPNLREAALVSYRYWFTGDPLDQGSTPQCVGYSGYQYLRAGPIRNLKLPFTASQLYKLAQENDEWEGSDYEGSSVRGLMKGLNKKGYVTEYQWTWDVNVLAAHVLTIGPVCVGTNWLTNMVDVAPDNILDVSGGVEGGHAYLICGANQKKKMLRMINSWGKNWGQNGKAWIRYEDFQSLLDADGEACTATEVKI